MATAGGPKIVTDGLVFGYDTNYGVADNSTATRFYPGEPATNNSILAAYTWNGDGGNQSFANKGATVITDNSLKYNGYDTVLWTPGGSQNCYLNGTSDFNYSDGSTVWTFSCYVKREDGAAITSLNVYMYYPSGDGAAAGTIVDCGNGWYRVSRTRTGGTSAIQLGGFTGFSAGNKYYLSGVMLSKTNHTVPYVAVQSSRSSTASLIDLKKTTDIDASSMSFDSTGQPTFDGTDDTLLLGSSSAFNITSKMSVFAWIKPDSISGWKGIFGGAISGFVHFQLYNGGISAYVYGPAASYGNPDSASIGTNVWTNVGFTFGNNTLKVYLNGEQLPTTVTGNGGNISSNSDVRVGWAYATSRLFDGHINALTVHNKALTDTEVKQNYNAQKNRFA